MPYILLRKSLIMVRYSFFLLNYRIKVLRLYTLRVKQMINYMYHVSKRLIEILRLLVHITVFLKIAIFVLQPAIRILCLCSHSLSLEDENTSTWQSLSLNLI